MSSFDIAGLFGGLKTTKPTMSPEEQFALIGTQSTQSKTKKSKATKSKKKKVQQLKAQQVKIQGAPSQIQLVSNTAPANQSGILNVPSIKDVKTIQHQEQDELDKQIATMNLDYDYQQNHQQQMQRAMDTIEKSSEISKVVEAEVNQKIQEAAVNGQTITPQVRQQIHQQVVQNVSIDKVTPDDYEVVKTVIEEENDTSLDNVNVPKLAAALGDALKNTPDSDGIDLTGIEVKVLNKKTREGYFKTKVTIKKDGIPEIINQISSEVKKRTKGLISPRVCDLRVIGNTNKTQLRNSSLKLSVNTVVFKPDAARLKVNKGTRFMISIPENFESTGNLLVYIQESRAKTIIEINTNELSDIVDFFATNISDYYYQGYDVTLKKLQRKGVGCPIMEVVNLIVANRGYKIKTYGDKEDNHIYMVDLFSKETETNEFIGVRMQESNQPGLWDVIAFDTMYSNEYSLNQTNKSIKYLMDNILTILNKVYDMDWNQTIINQQINSYKNGTTVGQLQQYIDDNEYVTKLLTTGNEIKKLTHRRLSIAGNTMYYMLDRDSESYNSNIDLQIKCISKQVMKKIKPNNYDAESIIGKTLVAGTDNVICEFVLTYLAYPIKAGDKRRGRDYITRQEYYQKYNVRDRRDYQKREKTILSRQNQQRNYNARPYLFQLEYKVNGNDYTYICKTFDELMENTKFLTLNPIGVNHVI